MSDSTRREFSRTLLTLGGAGLMAPSVLAEAVVDPQVQQPPQQPRPQSIFYSRQEMDALRVNPGFGQGINDSVRNYNRTPFQAELPLWDDRRPETQTDFVRILAASMHQFAATVAQMAEQSKAARVNSNYDNGRMTGAGLVFTNDARGIMNSFLQDTPIRDLLARAGRSDQGGATIQGTGGLDQYLPVNNNDPVAIYLREKDVAKQAAGIAYALDRSAGSTFILVPGARIDKGPIHLNFGGVAAAEGQAQGPHWTGYIAGRGRYMMDQLGSTFDVFANTIAGHSKIPQQPVPAEFQVPQPASSGWHWHRKPKAADDQQPGGQQPQGTPQSMLEEPRNLRDLVRTGASPTITLIS